MKERKGKKDIKRMFYLPLRRRWKWLDDWRVVGEGRREVECADFRDGYWC